MKTDRQTDMWTLPSKSSVAGPPRQVDTFPHPATLVIAERKIEKYT